MTRYEISCCFMKGPSTLDAEVINTVVRAHTGVFDGTLLLRTDEVFYGGRRAHTNVAAVVDLPDYKSAVSLRDAIREATGKDWNSPTEPDRDYGAADDWSMFTQEGNQKVNAAVDLIETSLRNGSLSPVNLTAAVDAHFKAIASDGHSEVYDTEPRQMVWQRIDEVLESLGIQLVGER